MDFRQPGEFLSTHTGQPRSQWLEALFLDKADTSKTYDINSMVLLGFGVFFFGLAALDIRRDYRILSRGKTIIKIALFLSACAVAMSSEWPGDQPVSNIMANRQSYVLSVSSMTGVEAIAFCARQNHSLPDASHVAE